MRLFYRVCNTKTHQGLWYNQDGEFTGLIHGKFDFCKHKRLPMEYDKELVGYLSATDSLDVLYEWFPIEDILKLQAYGYFIHVYEATDVKFYERFQHLVINKATSKIIKTIKL